MTDHLLDQGVKARYMHSDNATLERTEILRDLRRGEFDSSRESSASSLFTCSAVVPSTSSVMKPMMSLMALRIVWGLIPCSSL